MTEFLNSYIMTWIAIASFLLAIVALFVKIKDDQMIHVSRKVMGAILLIIGIASLVFAHHLETPPQDDSSISAGAQKPSDTSEPEYEDPETSIPPTSSPDTESTYPPAPESSPEPSPEPTPEPTPEQEPEPSPEPPFEPDIASTPDLAQVQLNIDICCDNDPAFADFYILVTPPDSDHPSRYDYGQLPAELEGPQGIYTVAVMDAWSDQLITEHPLEVVEAYVNWTVYFTREDIADAPDQGYEQTELTWGYDYFPGANLIVEVLDGDTFFADEVELLIGIEEYKIWSIGNCAQREIWIEAEHYCEHTAYIIYQDEIIAERHFYVMDFSDDGSYNYVDIQLP